MVQCDSCYRTFKGQNTLEAHLLSPRHARRASMPRCTQCRIIFNNRSERAQHWNSAPHRRCTQFRCCDCDRDFVNEAALTQHLRDKVHELKRKVVPAKSFSCNTCGKSFLKKCDLAQHEASSAHKPLCAPFRCTGSNKCRKRFTSPSGMINHLESGACKSGITRAQINRIIASHDTNHLITSPYAIEQLQTYPQSPITPGESWAIPTPSSSELEQIEPWTPSSTGSGTLTPVIYTPGSSESVATGSIQGDSIGAQLSAGRPLFLCPLCPPTSNRFRAAHDLVRHNMSPAHAPNIFHCPTIPVDRGVGDEKPTKFSTLSGVARHIESGACAGGKKVFYNVLEFVNERLREFGLREIKLLA